MDQAFHKARSEISTLGHELKLPKDQVGGAVQNLEKLAGEAKAGAPTPEKGAAIIKTIRDNYSWAYPLFKDFISVAWPALLTLIKA